MKAQKRRAKAKALSCATRYVWRWLWRHQWSVPDGTDFTMKDGTRVTGADIVMPLGPGWPAMRRRYRAQRIGKPRAVRFVPLARFAQWARDAAKDY